MKAVLQHRAGPVFERALAPLRNAGIETIIVDHEDHTAFAHQMTDADVLLHVLEPVTRSVITAAPRLKLIQKIGVGVNTIDRAAAADHGVRVANMPGTNSRAVAEHTLALMLATLRRIPVFDAAVRRGSGWSVPPGEIERSGELCGRTVGLIGFGMVPQLLAPILRAFGATVIHTSRTPPADPLERPFSRTLLELLAEADIVSLHIPSTDETRGLLDADRLSRMKSGAILINTARGDLIDEDALIEALEVGRLGGAGLDVFAVEPLRVASRLVGLETVILTPHTAWLTPETLARSIMIALENCIRLSAGGPLLHEVLFEGKS